MIEAFSISRSSKVSHRNVTESRCIPFGVFGHLAVQDQNVIPVWLSDQQKRFRGAPLVLHLELIVQKHDALVGMNHGEITIPTQADGHYAFIVAAHGNVSAGVDMSEKSLAPGTVGLNDNASAAGNGFHPRPQRCGAEGKFFP